MSFKHDELSAGKQLKEEKLVDYNELEMANVTDISKAQLEQWIGRSLCIELVKHYPNRNWSAAVDSENGIVAIMETDISSTKGYVIALSRPMDEIRGMMQQVGGEILERAGISREKKFDQEVFDNVLRTPKGDMLAPDLFAPEEKRFGSS